MTAILPAPPAPRPAATDPAPHARCRVCAGRVDAYLPHTPEPFPPGQDWSTGRAEALARMDKSPVRGMALPAGHEQWPDPWEAS